MGQSTISAAAGDASVVWQKINHLRSKMAFFKVLLFAYIPLFATAYIIFRSAYLLILEIVFLINPEAEKMGIIEIIVFASIMILSLIIWVYGNRYWMKTCLEKGFLNGSELKKYLGKDVFKALDLNE
ncbi:MAG: hypothetical protein GY866_39210 [Proteobacteria bacterium]|nr:hypothetical protein [Pseudomonadota bacterium]